MGALGAVRWVPEVLVPKVLVRPVLWVRVH